MIENERRYSITKTQTERFAWALEQLQHDKQDGRLPSSLKCLRTPYAAGSGTSEPNFGSMKLGGRERQSSTHFAADIPETITDEDLP